MITKEQILNKHLINKGISEEKIHIAAYMACLDAMEEYLKIRV